MKGISEINLFLKDWSYYDLQNKITNKAAEYGIEVVTIDPKYTSRRCSKCGNINTGEDNLKNDRFYVCELCGYRTSYDHNAARNIAFPNIEEEIDKQLAVQEIEPPKKDGRKSREEKNINSPVANRKG